MPDKKSDDFVIGKKRGSESDSLEVGSVERKQCRQQLDREAKEI